MWPVTSNSRGWTHDELQDRREWSYSQAMVGGRPRYTERSVSHPSYDSLWYSGSNAMYGRHEPTGSPFYADAMGPPRYAPSPFMSTPGPSQQVPNSPLFHPYQSRGRPLLFINTVAPPPSSKATGPVYPDSMPPFKPKQKRITPEQLVALTGLFEKTDSPSFDVREKLGAQLQMSNREVQVWFQNRRAKMNRIRQQQGDAVVNMTHQDALPSPVSPSSTVIAPPLHSVVLSAETASTVVDDAAKTSVSPFRSPAKGSLESRSSQEFLQRGSQGGKARTRPNITHIQIPDRRTFPPSSARPQIRSVSSPVASPLFGLQSPPLSATFPFLATSSTASPSFSSPSSGYFSPRTEATTPSSMCSPSSGFFRLSLESPALSSPRSEVGSPYYVDAQQADSALLRLAPMVNAEQGVASPRFLSSHSRSLSDGPSLGQKLPSFKAVVESVSPRPTSPGSQFGTSPLGISGIPSPSISTAPFRLQAVPRRPAHRRTLSNLSQTLPYTEEEQERSRSPEPVPATSAPSLGLGMLAIAAAEAESLDPSDLKKSAMYAETRRMSLRD